MPYKDIEKRREYERSRPYRNRSGRKKAKNNWQARNPRRYLLQQARYRASKSGVPFSITEEDIIIPEFCPVLDIKLQMSEGHVSNGSPTLDRIDNAKGYVPGNVAVISHRANACKSNLTADQLYRLYLYALDKHTRP